MRTVLCIGVLEPHMSAIFLFLFCLLLLLDHVVCITPSFKLSCSLLGGSHESHSKLVWTTTYYACAEILYACACYDTCPCVYVFAGLCICVFEPAIPVQYFILFYYACADILYACACYDTCPCVYVFAGLCICVLEPAIPVHYFILFFAWFSCAAADVSCRLYHTVPKALKISTLWQPRHNNIIAALLCGPLLSVCSHCIYMRVCDVCAMIRTDMTCATTAVMFTVHNVSTSAGVPADYTVFTGILLTWAIRHPMLHVSSNICCDCDTCLFLFNLRHPRDST